MTELHTVALPDPYGELALTQTPDLTSGQVRYVISGRRASGAFMIEPAFAGEELLPTRIWVRCGHEPADDFNTGPLINRPVINGITIAGIADLDPDQQEPVRRWHLTVYRAGSTRVADLVPDRTSEYAAAIITVLRTMWATHPLRHTLVATWARLCAEQRAEHLLRDELAHRYRRRDELSAEIHHYERRVADLRILATAGADAGSSSGNGQPALRATQVGTVHAVGVGSGA
ncbi:hypothetical protein ACGFIE_12105 [Micromonospora sp. NPDC049275]|uniref:hypothetical protein n=1 Tax=Micromonospora sp. NPDC049275 TaxID=3364268 RepID=UPI00370F8C6A